MSNGAVAEHIDVNINTVKLCLKKFKEGGIDNAQFVVQRAGWPVEITDDAVSWIVDLVCLRPADLGYSQGIWTLANLHKHIQKNAEDAGYPCLSTITKPMAQKIRQRSESKPFMLRYYCKKQDHESEPKIHNVLVVRKQISMQFDEHGSVIIPEDEPMIRTVSCDEKLVIQAIAITCDDIRPIGKTVVFTETLNTRDLARYLCSPV